MAEDSTRVELVVWFSESAEFAAAAGWLWGGDFATLTDWQHFER